MTLTANNLEYDIADGKVTASGRVEISSRGRRLLADRVSYDQIQDTLLAFGNVTLLEPTGEALFADELEVDGELATGFIKGLGVLLSDHSRIASARAVRREGRYTEFEEAVYSPCQTCAESGSSPVWQIRASRVIHDQEDKTISYRHARFELFGVPVAYAPYFEHPDPTVERRTGFLAPSAGTDSELGLTLEIPFHYIIADHRDITFSSLFTTSGGTVLSAHGRDLQSFGRSEVTASFTVTDAYQRQESDDSDDELRGHIKAGGRYNLGDELNGGFDLSLASDNTYLQRYGFSDDDILRNRVYVERLERRTSLTADAYGFQGLREFDEQARIPVALPWLRARWLVEDLPFNSELAINGDALALTRATGLDTRRFSAEAGWSTDQVGAIGDLWSVRASVRGDLYHINGDPRTLDGGDNELVARFLPRVSADWSWPLAAQSGSWLHVLEPLISATATVDDGNSERIANEDSVDFELDDTNLFEANRFVGLDRYDGGSKITYGGRFDSVSDQGLKVGGLVGQSYRFAGDSAFSEGSGVDSRFSDYVGRFNFEPNEFFNMTYRFRLGHENFQFRRSDLRVRFGPRRARFNIGYLNLSEEVTLDEPVAREELSAGFQLRITPELAAGFQSRIDLTENEPVAHMFGLVYTNDCFVITTGIERRFTSRGELNDTTRFALRIGLRNLGEVQTGGNVVEN